MNDGNCYSKFHFFPIQYRVCKKHVHGIREIHLSRGDMYLDIEIGGIGLVFCLQSSGAEQ